MGRCLWGWLIGTIQDCQALQERLEHHSQRFSGATWNQKTWQEIVRGRCSGLWDYKIKLQDLHRELESRVKHYDDQEWHAKNWIRELPSGPVQRFATEKEEMGLPGDADWMNRVSDVQRAESLQRSLRLRGHADFPRWQELRRDAVRDFDDDLLLLCSALEKRVLAEP